MGLHTEADEPHDRSSRVDRALGGLFAGEYPLALWAILAVALGLRIFQASNHQFTIDEIPELEVANSIRLNPLNLHLVFGGGRHPLLFAYLIHVGGLIFGPSLVGYRAPIILIGVLTCVAVYRLGRVAGTKGAGLWAAALMAIDQFHVTFTGDLQPAAAAVILFGTLAFLSCTRITPRARLGPFLGLGVWMGLAYLTNQTALMIFPALWAHMLVSRERRAILRDRRWYLAHVVFAAVVAPDIVWNLAHLSTGSYLNLSLHKATGAAFMFRGKFLSLFLGEILMIWDPNILGGPGYWCWPHRTTHWVAGVFYLGAVLWAVRHRSNPVVSLLLTTFLVVAVVVTLVPGDSTFDRYWWGAMAMCPAVILSGMLIDVWVSRTRRSLWIVTPLAVWLLVRTVLILDAVSFVSNDNCSL